MGFDIDNTKSNFDFDTWALAHIEPEQSKTSRFLTLSATLHAVAFFFIAMLTVPLVEQAKTETITIEIEEPTPVVRASRGENVPATQGGTPIKQDAPTGPEDVVVAKVKPAPATKAAGHTAKAKVNTKVAAPKTSGSVAAKTTMRAVPASIDDIDAPELDSGDLAAAKVSSPMNEDFNKDFETISNHRKTGLDSEKNVLDKMASALADEQDENLNALDEHNKNESAKITAMQDSLRKRNSESIAAALAAERAAAFADAAKEAAARNALAKKAGLGGNGNGYGEKQGQGAGNTGAVGPGKQLSGLPNGVRSLDQLRQMPGNPRPQYDREERRRGDQGEIAYHAYINKEGYPTKFRLIKSTGYQNLDSKTLNALTKWRFYPGQEGWVELPFRWDLKGGMQEDGGTLRRSVSRR